jgi:hypothetical protein
VKKRGAEKIDRMVVFDVYLYALTNHDTLYAPDIEKQAFRFGVQPALRWCGAQILEDSFSRDSST